MVLGGKDADHLRPDGDLDDLVASTRRPLVTFPLTVVAAGLMNYALLNAGSGGFATYYDVTGKYVHILRGDDEASRGQRRQAAVRLSANTQPESVRALIRATSHPDPETAAWACWVARMIAKPDSTPNKPQMVTVACMASSGRIGSSRTARVVVETSGVRSGMCGLGDPQGTPEAGTAGPVELVECVIAGPAGGAMPLCA